MAARCTRCLVSLELGPPFIGSSQEGYISGMYVCYLCFLVADQSVFLCAAESLRSKFDKPSETGWK